MPRTPPLLPPRVKNWKKGTSQVGVFLRTPEGFEMQLCNDSASSDQHDVALFLIWGMRDAPEIVKAIREHVGAKLNDARMAPIKEDLAGPPKGVGP